VLVVSVAQVPRGQVFLEVRVVAVAVPVTQYRAAQGLPHWETLEAQVLPHSLVVVVVVQPSALMAWEQQPVLVALVLQIHSQTHQ